MSRKAVFFDADGTVCDMKKGVPDSAIEAIRALVDNCLLYTSPSPRD